MAFSKINYEDLNPKQKEIYNFQKVASFLANYGFNCIKLADDWLGADFLAYHVNGSDTIKVQLKSRPTIHKKYIGKGLFIAFPIAGCWYLINHDDMIRKAGEVTNWLNTDSWVEKGWYSAATIGSKFLQSLDENKLDNLK